MCSNTVQAPLIPPEMLALGLTRPKKGRFRLKRCVLLGDESALKREGNKSISLRVFSPEELQVFCGYLAHRQ